MAEPERWPWVVCPREDRVEWRELVSQGDPSGDEPEFGSPEALAIESGHTPESEPTSKAPLSEWSPEIAAQAAEYEESRAGWWRERRPVPPELLSQPMILLSDEERARDLNHRLCNRVRLLGLSLDDLTWVTGYEGVQDLVGCRGEIFVARLGQVRRLLAYLRFDPFDLLDLKCAFHGGHVPYFDRYSVARTELIHWTREDRGRTRSQLAHAVQVSPEAIAELEEDNEALEDWSIRGIDDLAEALRLPAQLLLGFACPVCGR